MVILRRRLKKENKKDTSFIGASIPKDMVSFLSLFCLAKEVTKTSIVKDLVNSWVQEKQKEYSEKDLIKEIAMRSLEVWEVTPKRNTTLHNFKTMLRLECKYRGLDESVINGIIAEFSNEYEKK